MRMHLGAADIDSGTAGISDLPGHREDTPEIVVDTAGDEKIR